MKTRTNFTKYDHKWALHTTDESGKAAEKDEKKIEAQNKIKDVCLNCTKKKCRGSDECFKKERNKHD